MNQTSVSDQRVRVMDVTVAVTTPANHCPSPRTLGEDLRMRIRRRAMSGTHTRDELRAAYHRAIVGFCADWLVEVEEATFQIVSEQDGDGLVGVDVRMKVKVSNG